MRICNDCKKPTGDGIKLDGRFVCGDCLNSPKRTRRFAKLKPIAIVTTDEDQPVAELYEEIHKAQVNE